MLRECKSSGYDSYYNLVIAYAIFFRVSNYILLVVVVWSVNILLRKRLNSGRTFYKGICLAIISVMGALTCGYIGLSSYNTWTLTAAGSEFFRRSKSAEAIKLAVAYWILYLLSIVASGALSIVTLLSMRSKRVPIGNLLGWTIALILSMFIWVLLMVVDLAPNLPRSKTTISIEGEIAIGYIVNFFQSMSWVCVLFLAKSHAWDNVAVQNPNPNMYQNTAYQSPQPMPYGAPQQQYAYAGQPGQQYYYQQQPVYNGTVQNGAVPVNGNGHVVQVK